MPHIKNQPQIYSTLLILMLATEQTKKSQVVFNIRSATRNTKSH